MPPTPRILLRDVGLLLHVPGVLAVPCLVVALVTGEYALLAPLAVTIALSVGLGQAGYWARPDDSSDDAEAPGAVRLGALAIAWLLAAAIAAVPFTWAAHVGVTAQAVASYGSPLNAFFEAVSGLTGTGLTTSSDPSQLPHTLQFWRSALEWAGGIGIVLLAALVIHPAASLKPLFQNELHVGIGHANAGARPPPAADLRWPHGCVRDRLLDCGDARVGGPQPWHHRPLHWWVRGDTR